MSDVIGDDVQDHPTFIRQRRNVMVSCLVVITVSVLELRYDTIKVLDVKAGAPWNFDIGWACLIWYFLWRLSQCEPPFKILKEPDGYYQHYIKLKLPTEQELSLETEAALVKANANPLSSVRVESRDNQTGEIRPWKATKANFVGLRDLYPQKGRTSYKLAFEVELLQSNQTQAVIFDRELSHRSKLAMWTWFKGYVAACWRGKYFSEYLLPYLLGLGCIVYCCYHHLVS
jgi:hypothetical protein